jgi:hypothetical protein
MGAVAVLGRSKHRVDHRHDELSRRGLTSLRGLPRGDRIPGKQLDGSSFVRSRNSAKVRSASSLVVREDVDQRRREEVEHAGLLRRSSGDPRNLGADTEKVSASDVAAQSADFIAKGNELLKKAKEVVRRIEDRCRGAIRTDPDSGSSPQLLYPRVNQSGRP